MKRLLVGRPLRSDRMGETLLPKRLALPIFASDPLSSVAYARSCSSSRWAASRTCTSRGESSRADEKQTPVPVR
jgi:hypothetical protein